MHLNRIHLARLLLAGAFFGLGPLKPLIAELRLENFPSGDSLLLGTVPAKLQARREHTYYAPFTGPVEQIVSSPVGDAKTGDLLLYLDRERMTIETRLLAIERQLTEEQEIPEQQLALFQSLRQTENREAEIGQQLAFIQEIGKNPELAKLFKGGTELSASDQKAALERLERERNMTRRVLHSLARPELRALAEELVTLQLRKRELEHEKRLREARITMPFDGAYRLLLPLAPGKDAVPALQGDPLVQVEDLSRIYGLVQIHGVGWRNLPREQLQLRIPGISTFNREYRGDFSRAVISERERDGGLIYVFEFSGDAREPAARIRGGSVTGEILLRLDPAQTKIVPKLDLLKAYPDAFERSWKAGVRQLFEDVRAVHVGQDALAIISGEPE